MNAPKKIWMADECQSWAERDEIFHIPYIRADIVDELVEALKRCNDYISGPTAWTQQQEDALAEDVHAALAKLEESHD